MASMLKTKISKSGFAITFSILFSLFVYTLFISNAFAASVTHTYDKLSRVSIAVYPDGSTITYGYNAMGTLVSEDIFVPAPTITSVSLRPLRPYMKKLDGFFSITSDVCNQFDLVFFVECGNRVATPKRKLPFLFKAFKIKSKTILTAENAESAEKG